MNCTNDFTMFISGDFCPAYGSVDELLSTSVEKIFGDFYETIQNADLSITNLECPLTLKGNKIEKIGPNLKTNPEVASLLKSAGFDMVTLANNHIYDYGHQGLSDTLESLKKYNISYVGAGLDLYDAKKIFYVDIKEVTLAIVNFAEVEFSCANSKHGGANPMDLIDNVQQIRDARNNADHVLVIVHGGHEYYHYPSPETLKLYRFYVESGASAVIGHHTHCIGGYELYEERPIFYSLGNFFFPTKDKKPSFWYEGYALLLKITKSSLIFEILPYEQCKERKFAIKNLQKEKILKKIEEVNNVLSDNAKVEACWDNFLKERFHEYLTKISGVSKIKISIFRRLGMLGWFYRKSQLNYIRQMLQCKAHNEAARGVLLKYMKE